MATYQYFVNTYLYYQLVVEEVGTSIESNTSTVNWYVQVGRSNYGYSSNYTWSFSVSIGGNPASGSVKAEVTHDPVTIGSGTFYIPHNSDGTGSVYSSATVSSSRGSGSMGGTMALTTIPRASSLIVPTFTLGQAGTITIDRKSSSFTHTIRWYYGNDSGTVVENTSATSVSWTPDIELSKWTPSATIGQGNLRCVTYSGGTQIGITDTLFYTNVPSSVVPTIYSVTLSETNSAVTNIVGSANYVQNQSKIRVVISGSGVYGSTIASGSVTANGVTFSGLDVTLPAIGSASFTITASVTDTRGRTVTKNVAVSQLPYYAPAVSAFSCDRCTSKGADDDNGDYCKVKYTYKAYPLTVDSENKNTVTAKIQARQHRDTTGSWTDLITIADASSETDDFSATDVSNYSTVEVSADYQWDIKFTITDSFGVASEVTIMLHSADVIMDFKSDGTGIAFSKTAELSDTADFGDWAVKAGGYLLGETALDPVIASGTSGIWNYVKYSSGLAICTARRTQGGVNVGTAWGNIYSTKGDIITSISYPFEFTSIPMECVAVTTGSATMSAGIITGQTTNTTTTTGAYDLIRGTQAWWDGYIQYVVMGWWK